MDRTTILRHLQRANEHVAEGERHLHRQREIIEELERDGHNARLAREVLATLERVQEAHIAGRDRLADILKRLG